MTPDPRAWCVAVMGALPDGAEPGAVYRFSSYAHALKTFSLRDPVPDAWVPLVATLWRALAEGVARVFVAESLAALGNVERPLVVAGEGAPAAAAPQDTADSASVERASGVAGGPRLILFDAPAGVAPDAPPPAGAVGLWPRLRMVLPGRPGPTLVPASALAAGLFATGRTFSDYAVDVVPPAAGPAPPGWTTFVPAGRRRLPHLEPPPPGPETECAVSAVEPRVAALWAEAQTSANPLAALTRSVHAVFGPDARVGLVASGIRVTLPLRPPPGTGPVVLRVGPTR